MGRVETIACALCCDLAEAAAPALAGGEWSLVRARLAAADLGPEVLTEPGGWAGLGLPAELAERIAARLGDLAAVEAALAGWEQRGMRLLVSGLDGYPDGLDRLGESAPPVLFLAGPAELLGLTGLAVVGSRDAPGSAIALAAELGRRCARAVLATISGSARGVDQAAMQAALGLDGPAVGVLPHGLGPALADETVAAAVAAGRLALVSPYPPEAMFTAARAVARNRLIHCLGQWVVVVASAAGRGGTWTGSMDNLRHGWRPLFAATGSGAGDGCRRLLGRGAIALDPARLDDAPTLLTWLREQVVLARDHAGRSREELLASLGHPRSLGDLHSRYGLPPAIARELLDPEVAAGRVTCLDRPRRYLAAG